MMNCSPTLSAEDFKNVHNGKCELHSILQAIDGIVHPKVQERLEKAIELINIGLKSAYDQDDAAFTSATNHFEEVGTELGIKYSNWSMHEIPDLRTPHPYPEHTILCYEGMGEVGEVKVRIEGPLWTDLWKAAEEAIVRSRDHHHIFIEDFHQSKTRDLELWLSTGS
jgi:hypothetical protein